MLETAEEDFEVGDLRDEVREFIEVTIVELKAIAQPKEIAQLRELAMDAEEADGAEQLASIRTQAQNLRTFCEKRLRSSATHKQAVLPTGRRRV
jgi:hypothetical protein